MLLSWRWIVCLAVGACLLPLAVSAQTSTAPASQRTAPSAGQQAARPRVPVPSAAAVIPPPDPARMEAILREWSARSRQIKSLYARFTREDVVQAWQDKTRYDGTAYIRSPNLAYLNFEKMAEDGKPRPHERIVCTGDKVFHFLAEPKQVHVYTLSQQDRQRALEEGPLPFLFNMDAEAARKRYAMTLSQENDQLYLITISPITEVDRESFSRAYIYLDKKQYTPTKIILVDPANRKDTKTFTIAVVQPNVKVADSYFDAIDQTQKVVKSAHWDVVEYDAAGEPLGRAGAQTPPAAGEGLSAPPTGLRRPATAGVPAPTPR